MLHRKQLSGHQKQKRKKQIEIVVKSQKSALDGFFSKHSTTSIQNNVNPYNLDSTVENFEDEQSNRNNEEYIVLNVDNNENENILAFANEQPNEPIPLDIYDPRTCNNLISDLRDELLKYDPKRDVSIVNDPKDIIDRPSSSSYYIHYCGNGENQDRSWLVYSKELNKVFCFCCEIFCRSPKTNHLAQ
ncbi:unnamed protein product [Lathyrus oleraceus]